MRPWRLAACVRALSDEGVRGVTTSAAFGLGAQRGEHERYGGHEFDDSSLVEKRKLEVVIVGASRPISLSCSLLSLRY